jgi:hypothetical protein
MCVPIDGGNATGHDAPVPRLLNKTLRLFLDSIGRREEYEYYLERFRADHAGSFAVLCPDHDGFADVASIFAFDMGFLLRLGLDPIVLLSGAEAESMQDMLCVEAHPFVVERVSAARLAQPDAVEQVLGCVARCRAAGRCAVLVCSEIGREACLALLVPAVTRRVHLIRVQGPLHAADGNDLFYYYVARPDRVPLAAEDEAVAALAGRLLARAAGVHVSVASPLRLLEELFTVKGAGCVIRLGARIMCFRDLAELDVPRLTALLESSFGRPLASREFLARTTVAYVEERYRGAALLEKTPTGMYLSTFSVGAEARGEGLAVELWRDLTADHPALFWRARTTNPINQWYDKQADGYHREGRWNVFWRGMSAAQVPSLVAYALACPEDFVRD